MTKAGRDPPEIWSTLLDSVGFGTQKVLPTKDIIVLGGGNEGVAQLLQSLRNSSNAYKSTKKRKRPLVPNTCDAPCGYAFVDIEDRDTDDTLARIGIYSIPEAQPGLMPLLETILASRPLSNTAVWLLLDWQQPWTWIRELRFWIRHMKQIMLNLRRASKDFDHDFKENNSAWEMRLRHYREGAGASIIANMQSDSSMILPLDEGQFDEPLGLPLICIAQNAENIDTLDREHGVKDDKIDFVQQFLRTILLKHGGTLLYTKQNDASSMSLPMRVFLQEHFPVISRELHGSDSAIPATVLERDAVYVPPGWDTWGKITVLREGFSVRDIAVAWTEYLDLERQVEDDPEDGALGLYEAVLADCKQSCCPHTSIQTEQFVDSIDPMPLIQRIEQRQWQVKETNNGSRHDDDDDLMFRDPGIESRPDPSRAANTDGASEGLTRASGVRPAGNRSSSQSPITSAPTNTSRSGANKDEYVHAFFQNLLTRSNSEKDANKKQGR